MEPQDRIDVVARILIAGVISLVVVVIIFGITVILRGIEREDSGWAIAASILLGSGLIALAIWRRR